MNTAVKSRTDASPKPQVVGERGKFSMRGLPLLAQGTACKLKKEHTITPF